MSSPAAAVILRRINATRFIYFLYQVLQIALTPALALYLLYRGIRNPRYWTRFGERLGLLPDPLETTGPGAIWFHAVSVGEVNSCLELIRRLRAERPRVKIYVSTATLAGREAADHKLGGVADGVFFAPLDYRSVVRRVLRRLRPALVVVLETEIWPNLYRESKRAGALLLVVNGRISDRAFPRYRRWRPFFQYVLHWPDAILAQSEGDAERYVLAGAPRSRIRLPGNLKYDFIPPAAGVTSDIARFVAELKPSNIWIAASTMAPFEDGDVDEDDAVIDAFRQVTAEHPGLLLILAPRRPERFNVVAAKLEQAGVPFARRSRLPKSLDLPGVLLLDSIGELAALFERTDVVFMGGTLARRGGHNILEPAYFAQPVVVGPHMENFSDIACSFHEHEALARIEGPRELGPAVAELLRDAPRRTALGARARELAMSKRGVGARIAQEIWRAYDAGVPNPPPSLAARMFLTPCTWLWSAGHRVNMKRSLATRRALTTPVVSIGGLTLGGSGKSPMVAHLAARLHEAGRNPAILTRGYKRTSPGRIIVVPRGESASPETTGDEAQIFIRAGDAHVGIGADRFAAGARIERELAPDIFLLDDGFQHLRLDRSHDIVLIDALDPLAGGVFPLGRLREPLESLARADIIVLTRVEPGQNVSAIEFLLRQHNPKAPIFRSRVVPRDWVDVDCGAVRGTANPGFRRVAAFCGLGAPRAFWRTLEQLGLEIAFRQAFPDHHRYRAADLRKLAAQAVAAGAEVLATTQKDAINLPPEAAALVAPLKLLWLNIGIEIENQEELLRRIP